MTYYTNLYLKNKPKVPFPLAILIVFIITLFFANLFHKKPLPSKATKKLLKRLEITNLTPNQATIVWETEEKTTGFILYGENEKKLTSIILDERDTVNNKNKFFFHYVNLKNLSPGKKYFFVIVSDNQMIKKYEDEPFSFFTPKLQLPNKTPTLIYGKVLQETNIPLVNAIVFLNVKDYYSFSSFTKETGEWLIPLNVFYSLKDLTPKVPSSSEKVLIEIISENGLKTKVEGEIKKLSPIPQPLFIGRDYSFIFEEQVLGATFEKEINKKEEIKIIYPEEKAVIPGFTPLIKGKAIPGNEVLVNLLPMTGNKNYSARLKTDKYGFWSIRFLENLPLGSYQLIARTKSKDNKEIEVKREFRLVGNQAIFGRVLGEATPSATIVLSPTPTSQILPTETLQSPTPSPMIFYSTPTPTPFVSGSNNVILFSFLGILAIGLGLRLFFGF